MRMEIVFDLESFCLLESLRFETFGISDCDIQNSYYTREFKNKKIVAIEAKIRDEVLGGIYISNTFDSLFVDYLFVSSKYQNSELHIGSSLLNYVVNHKELFEDYFDSSFNYSMLEPRSDESRSYYNKLGYKDTKTSLMRRTLN